MIASNTRRFHIISTLIGAFVTCLAAPLAHATDYYIAPAGDDAANGTSAATPWKSLAKVNATTFLPGDNILFQKGGTWTGSLWPKGSGNSTSQITLATYGSGAKPLIDAQGAETAVIKLSNQEYWTIDGFEVTNWATSNGMRWGIRVEANDGLVKNRIRILNNTVRDIYGIMGMPESNGTTGYWVGGIYFQISEPGKADDVLIEGNFVTNIIGEAICFWAEDENSGGMNYANCSPRVVVRKNTVLRTSGDGILLLGTDNELAEYNEVGYVSELQTQWVNTAAAWPTRHKGGLWQYNHVHHTRRKGNDGTAFDNDGFTNGTTIFQHNVSHDNEGGFIMEYTWGGDVSARTIARYNISWNDNRIIATNRNNALLHNNVFYNPGATLDVNWTQNPSGVQFYNNLFVAAAKTTEFSRQVFNNNNFSGGMGRPVTNNGNVTTDPMFVSPNTTGNLAGFLLQAGSAARSAGSVIILNGGKDFWGVTLPATAPHRGASQMNAISDYTATPTFLTATGPFTATLPATGSTTLAFTAQLRDQNFRLISSPAITWSLSPTASGYSIDANGVVTITSTAQPQRIAVVATSGSLTSSSSFSAGNVDIVLATTTFTDTRTYGNGTVNGSGNYTVATFAAGANYTFKGNLTIPVEWNSLVLNSGAALNVGGTLGVDLAGVSLNGGTLTAGGILLQDGPDWVGTYNDGKQSIARGDSIINGSTLVANQSNSSFISLAPSVNYSSSIGNNLWLGNDGATVDSSGFDIGITMNLQNFSGQTGTLTKAGDGTLTVTGSNGYTGGTTITGGTLLASRNTLGTGAVIIQNGGTLYANDQWILCGANPYGVNERNIGTLTINAGGTLQFDATNGFANGATNLHLNGGLVTGGPNDFRGDLFLYNGNEQITAGGATTSTITSIIGVTGNNNTITVDTGSTLTITGGIKNSDWFSNGSTPGGIIKAGNGTLTLTGANSYTGTTTVNGGTLQLGNGISPTNLADTSDVSVSVDAMLYLDYSGTDQIRSLWVDGLQMPPGIYSSTSGFITGPGTLTVTTGPASTNYAAWSGRGINDLTGGPSNDDDNDAIPNLLEYVLGGNPRAASNAILPTATTSSGNLVFTFRRIQSTTSDTTQIFQYGTNLSGWSDVSIIAGGIVGIQPNTPQTGTDTVTITLPAGTEPRIFGRLKVSASSEQ
jgi:autotransporter-associated beta strand protein